MKRVRGERSIRGVKSRRCEDMEVRRLRGEKSKRCEE